MNWYFSKDGAQHGPLPEGKLQAKLRSGEISADALVWRDGMTDWTPASKLAELTGGTLLAEM